MRQPIHRYFQVGVIAAMAFPFYNSGAKPGVEEAVRKIACDSYFTAIELNPVLEEEKQQKVAHILGQAHMKVCYGAQARLLSAGLNPNDLDEAGRQKAEQTLLAGVDEASRLGAQGIAFLAGRWQPGTQEQAMAQLLKTTQNLCAYAQTKGIFVELEVFDFDIDKRALIGPAAQAAAFAAQVRCVAPNFGLMVDLSHIPMCYETPAYVLGLLRPYLTHFHIGNTVMADAALEAYGDEHPRFGYPGSANDTAELLDFFQVLKREGFFNAENPYVLSFEVKPRPGEDIEVVLGNGKRVLNRAWALLED